MALWFKGLWPPPSLFFFPHPQFLNSGGKISIIWSDAGLWRSHKCTKKWQRTALPSPIIVDYLNLCGASYLVISSTSFKLMEAYLSSKPYWSLHTKRDTCWVCVQARTVMRCKWELQAAQMNLCSASLRLYHMLTEVKKKKKEKNTTEQIAGVSSDATGSQLDDPVLHSLPPH